jgi:hypothetical protein
VIYEITLLVGRFPGFALFSFWSEEHIDENENAPLLE